MTDIARQKNAEEPKDVVKNWMRLKNNIEYLGLWEKINNPQFKGAGFEPLFQEAGSNAFTHTIPPAIIIAGGIFLPHAHFGSLLS